MTFCYLPQELENRPFLRNIVLEMYAGLQEKLAYNVPFIIVILRFVIYGQPQFLGK
jgi:hypothetical protein